MGLPFVNRSRTARRRRAAVASMGRLEALEARQLLSTFTVTSTLDDGSTGTLRWAIGQVNADTADSAASPDQIAFNIPGTGPFTISPTTVLPTVGRPVVIDGYSQLGAHPNTLPKGDDAVILIQLDGTQAGTTSDGLTIAGGSSTVDGLSITGFNNGIHLEGSGSDAITGDFIGLAPSGTTVAGNANDGVFVDGGSSGSSSSMTANTIGGTAPGARDLISGNGSTIGGAGVYVFHSDNDVVQGDYVGTDTTGTVALGNPFYGVQFVGGSGGIIGGNLIAGTGTNGAGILLDATPGDDPATSALVQNNLVGIDVTGTKVLGNGVGIGGAESDTILNNVISGSSVNGLVVGSFDVVQGNFIGTDITGTKALGNGKAPAYGDGGAILVLGGQNTIGGVSAGAGNLLSGNAGIGLDLASQFSGSNLIQGNRIGTDVTGTLPLGNGLDGITLGVFDAFEMKNTIGGTTPGAGNLISANAGFGIELIFPSSPSYDLIEGNLIGTDASGTKALGNGMDGISLEGFANTIGGATPGAGNVISGNGGSGITLTALDTVQGNFIGTDAAGLANVGNADFGINLTGSDNTIGGVITGGNTIAHNGAAGVVVGSAHNLTVDGDSILFNSIHDNAKLGIDLGDDGVTLNTPGGPHFGGPNDLQNYPILQSALSSADSTIITGTLNSAPNSVFFVQFFSNSTADPSGYGQGQTYLGLAVVTTDANGNASFSFQAPGGLAGKFISSTATSASTATFLAEDTSEFSLDIQAQAVPITPTSTAITSVQPSAPTFGQPVTFTATVTPFIPVDGPSGTITFSIDGVPQAPSLVVPTDGGFAGLATFTASGLAAGSHTITASYGGDASFDPSVSRVFSVTVGQAATTTTLAVAPSTATAGQPVTLSATVAGPGTPGGAVTFFDGSTPIGTVALGQGGTAVLVLTSLAPGSHSLSATYAGDSNHLASTSAAVIGMITPTGDGPKVVEVDRFGFHAMPTVLVLLFNQPMDAVGAENPANYLIIGPRHQTIRVKAAVLDPGSMAVTLSLRERLNLHLRYTLIVKGTSPGGLQGTSGLLLDGAGKGVPGSDYVASITFKNLRGASNGHPIAVARQVSHPAPHASGHLAQRHASKRPR